MATPAEWLQFAPKPRSLSPGEKWNVFLSYRSVDRTWVLNLYDVLREQGFEVFLDQCVLRGGDELIRTLENGLAQSQAGVLVWSAATHESDWVLREYQALERQASRRSGFAFVPVRLDTSELPVFAQNRVFLDFSSYPDGPNGGELLRLLHAITGLPLSQKAAHFADEQDAAAKIALNDIGAAVLNGEPEDLLELLQLNTLPWRTSSTLPCKALEALLRLGRNEEALHAAEQIRTQFPRAVRPAQLQALALARRGNAGDLRSAQRILGALYNAGQRDPETVGIYARTWMDRYDSSRDERDLCQSRDLYVEAFESAADDFYTGINAAAKSALLGSPEDIEKAGEYARRVQDIVSAGVYPGDYWKTATAAEASLLQRDYVNAARFYRAAVGMARSETGSHDSTWKQACRLLHKLQPLPEERSQIRAAFTHLPDCP